MLVTDGTTHARRLLVSQYLSRVSPRSSRFLWPSDESLLRAQAYLVRDLFGEFGALDLQSSPYDKSFLKELIARIESAVRRADEEEEWETDSDLLELYTELMTAPASTSTSGAPSEKQIQYIFPRLVSSTPPQAPSALSPPTAWHTITLLESSTLIGAGSTAVKTWEAALRLASHLLYSQAQGDDSLIRSGARVLELGSGTGLLTCFVALLQRDQGSSSESAPIVVGTDLASVVHGKLRETVELNDLASQVALQDLNWDDVHSTHSSSILDQAAPTTILGADIIFDPDLIPPLVGTIKCALQQSEGSQALIASTIRNEETYKLFLGEVHRAGLEMEEVELRRYEMHGGSEDDPPIVPFNSDHDAVSGGVVKGLRIWCGAGGD